MNQTYSSPEFAAEITKKGSRQTFYTIRFFVDRERVGDAYRGYAYFRWLDDLLDDSVGSKQEKLVLVARQQKLLDACYRGKVSEALCKEEAMLVDLVCNDTEPNSGLQSYLRNMMKVMRFDVERRYRVISQAELAEYTQALAKAVTDYMHHFIGHDDPPPPDRTRYLAVNAAHITHMLRDTVEDVDAGYFNIPIEYLQAEEMLPSDINNEAYRRWVCERVELARMCFAAGREYMMQIKNWRCRLAGFAYIARFEWVLGAIERENYSLRDGYPELKGLQASLWVLWSAITSMLSSMGPAIAIERQKLAVQPETREE
ncbi:MAG: squalene/phytoene synthase family protein [Chloroflexi bacterium]|nr:squalene/phytoene synthase family protein [Chloroflexota bacterium]